MDARRLCMEPVSNPYRNILSSLVISLPPSQTLVSNPYRNILSCPLLSPLVPSVWFPILTGIS